MPLTNCPECGRQVSTAADACPECGHQRASSGDDWGNNMGVPSWVITGGALLMALPFGYGLGVTAAFVIAGNDFGQMPIVTVPLGIVVSMVFAIWPTIKAGIRLLVLSVGTAIFILIASLLT